MATYELVLSDALAVMENRTNTRVFRDKSELEVIDILVREWRNRNWVLGATFDMLILASQSSRRAPRRKFIMQHNESDAAFVRRLLQRRSIAWFFQSGLPKRRGQDPHVYTIGHTLVVFDEVHTLKQNAAGTVRFHRDAATEERDAINAWSATRSLRPGAAGLHSWDYKNPVVAHRLNTHETATADQGELGSQLAAGLDDYRIAPPHAGENADDLLALTDGAIARFHYETKSFHGEGGVRDLAVGEWITLQNHPDIDTHPPAEREFVITEQEITARNNLPVVIEARVDRLFDNNGWSSGRYATFATADGKSPVFRSRFKCVRRGTPIVPERPTVPRPALQTAIVVGPVEGEVWCDELARIKIRFPGTRPADHAHSAGAGSSDSETDSAWVRVATHWTGPGLRPDIQHGTRILPRVGAEVMVDFAGGDPDKPVVIGQLYNSYAPPPSFKREDVLPRTRHQSGIRSQEVRGARGNQLRLDDTPGQISAQLGSDHAASELNLGYLTEARREQQGVPRGEGAELRSDEAIALRAAKGILLSTWHVLKFSQGKLLERDEHLRLLRECAELCAALGDYAAGHNALAVDHKEQADLLGRFEHWEDGSNTVPKVAERGEPVIGVSSPAGIGFASAKAIVSYSARNIDTVAQQHLQCTAGQRFSVNAGKGISLFAQHGGLHAIAHHGSLLLQSQHGDTDINAAKELRLSATEGTATISAKVILLVAEDGSFLKLGEGSPVIGSKHPLKFQAPDYLFDGPESMTAQFPTFGTGGVDQKFDVRYAAGIPLDTGERPQGAAVDGVRMLVALSDGSRLDMRSGADGKSDLLARDAIHIAEITLVRGEQDQ